MGRDEQEADIIALAAEGVELTVANVTARLGVPPRQAERLLEDMQRAGYLDSYIDDGKGTLVYRAIGLSTTKTAKATKARGGALDEMKEKAAQAAGAVLVKQAKEKAIRAVTERKPGERSVLYGAILGGVLGPLGLAYAAPWKTVLVSLLIYAGAVSLPIIKTIFLSVIIFVHLVFAIAGALYTLRFNQKGVRSPILPPEEKDSGKLPS